MSILILGLLIFLGAHSVRIFADDWRTRRIARLGAGTWKGLYSVVSAVGLVLIVWGYGLARSEPALLWTSPPWMRHVTALLTIPAFILVAAAYVPGNRIKPWLGHPMVAGVKVWAFAHLLVAGTLAGVILFGAFLAWAVADFTSARRRDRRAGTVYPPGTIAGDAVAVIAGLIAWAAFAFYLHALLIGVQPMR